MKVSEQKRGARTQHNPNSVLPFCDSHSWTDHCAKFLFHCKYSKYMHDSPQFSMFFQYETNYYKIPSHLTKLWHNTAMASSFNLDTGEGSTGGRLIRLFGMLSANGRWVSAANLPQFVLEPTAGMLGLERRATICYGSWVVRSYYKN